MSTQTATLVDAGRITNPFSTRWVRPGALRYQFPEGNHAAMLLAELRGHHWRGAIIGPHGSGKSALLATLTPEIERAGRAVRAIILSDGQRHLPADFPWPGPEEPSGLLIVDGYEQLGWCGRRRLGQFCRRSGWGLLISAHSDTAAGGFPVLLRTSPDLATVQRLVAYHLPPHGGLIQPADVASAFRAHRGNVRETFFALYDLFEQRRS